MKHTTEIIVQRDLLNDTTESRSNERPGSVYEEFKETECTTRRVFYLMETSCSDISSP